MPMSMSEKVASGAFGLFLLAGTLPAFFVALAGGFIVDRLSESQQEIARPWFNKTVITVTGIGWRIALGMSFWIGIHIEDPDKIAEAMGKSGRSSCVLVNHTSFMDTILALCIVPLKHAVRMKMMAAEYVFKMPVIGVLCGSMGHLPVAFKAKSAVGNQSAEDENNMSVDQEQIAVQQKKMDDFVASGGTSSWYPEGKMNTGDCGQVGTFRAGGMALPVKQDVEIWCMAITGASTCWPRKASMGGLPSRIGIHIFRFCESTQDYLAKEAKDADDRGKAIHLANATQKAVQEKVTGLIEKGFTANRGLPDSSPEAKKEN
eukprot:TRINITY_DN24731_c0_g1_i1.p1 TRINITY_DN24731_c0_g1~~TRINITY_DN24731_c0_g1_i1.p1  ORF type:complete len:318 (+),score=78.30 TRINITY_DN24731_c0_g1_i1:70-1023(+)